MRFLADMGISQSTVIWLKEKGYDAYTFTRRRST